LIDTLVATVLTSGAATGTAAVSDNDGLLQQPGIEPGLSGPAEAGLEFPVVNAC
jgi:hypothetical protein